MRIAVVGGGISGLTAAYRLTQAGASVTLYEAGDRLGGVIRTERRDGYLMEGGPDCFLDKPPVRQLCSELGLSDQLIQVRPSARRSLIVRGRRLLPIPAGLYLMAPSAVGPFIRSPVVSWPGKARMLLDLVLPARRSLDDESLGSFVRRRLGREALERLAQPLIGGIYGADPECLSLAATMPQFLEMERQHGSIVRALLRRRQHASGARYGLFLTFRGGMQMLVDALASRIPDVQLNAPVTAVTPRPGGSYGAAVALRPASSDQAAVALGATQAGAGALAADVHADAAGHAASQADEPAGWALTIGGDTLAFDAICLALPSHACAALLPGMGAFPNSYSSAATINLGFRRSQLARMPAAAGFVVPAIERRTIMACTFSSQKFEGRAPDDRVLLRAFAGGMLNPKAYALSDGELVDRALGDLRDLLGISGEPEQVWLTRCERSMPQYEVGHRERIAQLETSLPPGLALAGNGYRGVGVPDCIASGLAAAERLLATCGA
ncbi:MAG TPA: protoporphyrinogen oxidase [Chloroflexota bacterium]|nr:protoporphyrinogen oxidase [Chloroflexota bacterium]